MIELIPRPVCVSHSGRVCMCTACAGDAVCRLCGAHTAHVDGIALCAIVMTTTTLTRNGYDCHDTCDGDFADDDARADNDYDCNDADHVIAMTTIRMMR